MRIILIFIPKYAIMSEKYWGVGMSKTRTANGITTSNLVFSSCCGNNADLFPQILQLYVEPKSKIADVTYGKGVFWKNVDLSRYRFFPSDIKTGTDCRKLPYEANSMDCVVLDPPYMEGLYRREVSHMAGNGNYASFREAYSNGEAYHQENAPKYHDAVLDLYFKAGNEVFRILKDKGIFIVKCQDEVSANKQHLTHVEIINYYISIGFMTEDLFVLVRNNRPSVTRLLKQKHARKNHSYFLVFRKSVK